MVTNKMIRTEEDYRAAMDRIDEIFDAPAGTPEGEELDLLVHLIEVYEAARYPIPLPDPVAAIEFRMEQQELTQRDLIPYIGSRSKVSEVLSGKRQITMRMARALNQHLGISAEVLLQEGGASFDDSLEGVEWERFPLCGNGATRVGQKDDALSGLRGRVGARFDGERRWTTGRHTTAISSQRASEGETRIPTGTHCRLGVGG